MEFFNYNNRELIDTEKPKVIPQHFDAIFLNLKMPIMDGIEACKQIVKIYKYYKDLNLNKRQKSNQPQHI